MAILAAAWLVASPITIRYARVVQLGRPRRDVQDGDALLLVNVIGPGDRLANAEPKQCDTENAQHRNAVMIESLVGIDQLAVSHSW
jgi:hypothetical protein